jgi:pSer/pThr/pTyr-binding forkhead associated (FHA) protein
MSLTAKLLVVGGDVKTTEIHLKLPATIGRGRDASIVLPHPLVSRRHCELYEAAGQLMVRDLGSLNGTFVNSERVTESPLPAGELLTIGTVTFRAVYEANDRSQRMPGDKTVEFSKTKTIVAQPEATLEDLLPSLSEDRAADDRTVEPRPGRNGDRLKQTVPSGSPSAADRNTKTEPVPASRPAATNGSPPKSASKPSSKSSPDSSPDSSSSDDDIALGFSASEDDDEAAEPSASDDDLNDFLKGLGK